MAQWHLVSFHGQIPGDAAMAAQIFIQHLSRTYRESGLPQPGVIYHHQTPERDHSYLIPPAIAEGAAATLKKYEQRTVVLAEEPDLDRYAPQEL